MTFIRFTTAWKTFDRTKSIHSGYCDGDSVCSSPAETKRVLTLSSLRLKLTGVHRYGF